MSTKELAHQIFQDYMRVKQELGKNPSRNEYRAHGKFSTSSIDSVFGGWMNFLQTSGIQYSQKGKRDKQEIRQQYYEHLLKEIENFRSSKIVYAPTKSLLVIGDGHCPFMHQDYFQFCLALSKKYVCDRHAWVGDEVDFHDLSFHDSNPDLLSAGPELEAAIRQLEPFFKAFPQMDIAESNHGSLVFRKGLHHGIPRQVLSSYHDILKAPPDWRWHFKIEVEMSNGKFCEIHHSYGANVLAQSKKRGRSLIQGHHHNEAGVQWWGNGDQEFFAAFTGCGIDDVSMAFAYNKNQVERPRLGALVVLEGIPQWKPMLLDKNGRWNGTIP